MPIFKWLWQFNIDRTTEQDQVTVVILFQRFKSRLYGSWWVNGKQFLQGNQGLIEYKTKIKIWHMRTFNKPNNTQTLASNKWYIFKFQIGNIIICSVNKGKIPVSTPLRHAGDMMLGLYFHDLRHRKVWCGQCHPTQHLLLYSHKTNHQLLFENLKHNNLRVHSLRPDNVSLEVDLQASVSRKL